MSKLLNKLILVIFLLLLLGAGVFLTTQDHSDLEPQSQETITVKFFTPNYFWNGVGKAKQNKNQIEIKRVHAALVPHHLIAGDLISEIFTHLQKQQPKTIILVGPNHYELGATNIQTSSINWQSEIGTVLGKTLSLPNTFEATKETLINEHSVSGLMPYISHYLPEAKVYTIILKRNASDAEIEELSNNIKGVWNKDTMLLTSVDFAHDLPFQESERRDRVSRNILLELDEQSLYPLSKEYFDSPSSLSLMFKLCKKLGSQTFTITNHSNSATILNNMQLSSTTSYFTGFCEER